MKYNDSTPAVIVRLFMNIANGKILMISLCLFLIYPNLLEAQVVNVWLTSGDKSKLFQQQAINLINSNPGGYTISIDTSVHYQTMDGFGFCLTEGSAEVISSLLPAKQDSVLRELFDPIHGIGLSVLRICIGASDLSGYSYSYDDLPEGSNDTALTHFSLAGPDADYLIPILKKILLINPKIKLMGSPWSAPRWMKTTYTWVNGTLNPVYYQTYADYFVKYLDAMKAEGINFWAITPQNEPENNHNNPSMTLTSAQEIIFINNHLGPTLKKAGYSTKIIAFDHNCNNSAYPIDVCNQSEYVDGAGFHLYKGDISMLTTVYNATHKNIYFTEQYTASTSNFSDELVHHMRYVMIGSVNHWAKTAIEWNLATDANFGPHTSQGGCATCMGAITVNSPTSVARNVSYYIAAHMSKFVLPGSQRIGLSNTDSLLYTAAFRNADRSIALIVMNDGGAADIKVGIGGKYFSCTIPGKTAASFIWEGIQSSSIVLSTPSQNINTALNDPLDIPVTATGGVVSRIEFYNGTNLIRTDSTAPFVLSLTPELTGTSVITCKAFDVNGNYAASLGINLTVFKYKPIPAIIQAEDYDNMSGVQTENCSDVGAGLDVGYLETNDYMEYYVDARYSGIYKVQYRVAGSGSGSFNLLEDGVTRSTINVPSTGGYQTWTTISGNTYLNAGKHALRVSIAKGGWNINYIIFDALDSTVTGVFTGNSGDSEIFFYTNSGNDNLLYFKTNFQPQGKIVVSLSNSLGEIVLLSEYNNPDKDADMQMDLGKLPAGIYFLNVQTSNGSFSRKIIKN